MTLSTPTSFEFNQIIADPDAWEFFREGIDVHWLYRPESGEASSAALLRYKPGAKVPPHRHTGNEHVFVIEGSQTDENGVHEQGSLTVNTAGSQHSVTSENGCIVYVVWEKPIAFL